MKNPSPAESLFRKTLSLAVGLEPGIPSLARIEPPRPGNPAAERIWNLLTSLASGKDPFTAPEDAILRESCEDARQAFVAYYTALPGAAEEHIRVLDKESDPEKKARRIAEIWAPELAMDEGEILRRWMLSGIRPNPRPIKPTEVAIQLNALYTLPEIVAGGDIPDELLGEWKKIEQDPGPSIADYDHPVPVFERESHELLDCLDELESDLSFEKETGVLPGNFRVPVVVSVSVTHPGIDGLAGRWVRGLIEEKKYRNIETIVLTEEAVRYICSDLLRAELPLFTVLGAYGAHFNALKYTQLILEKSHGIRAAFKLDTDEGIHSKDLYEATGKTWFQTMCHRYWGGHAVDWRGREVLLGINEGEYINSTDIEAHGYPGSLRCPDVRPPSSFLGPDLFFAKGFAHAGATALYNRFDHLEDHVSHPVVKGGGYGVTNEALRQGVPFTLSIVGRAEDQQFYFSGVSRGVRGIFHPDLRIAHYKDRVSKSEKKTDVTRFAGDMFRLVLFGHLAEVLGVKDDIDPMPGIFASPLAPAQSFFHILIRAYGYAAGNRQEDALFLLGPLIDRLRSLKGDIDNGTVARLLQDEERGWRDFISRTSALSREGVFGALKVISTVRGE